MVSILVVEDDVTTQFLMTEFIETLGYECRIVSNGEECIGVLSENPDAFDLVLMDIHMPGMTGIDASRRIRNDPSNPARSIPIIAVTADVGYHQGHALKESGINEVLPKPVDLNALDDAILRLAA